MSGCFSGDPLHSQHGRQGHLTPRCPERRAASSCVCLGGCPAKLDNRLSGWEGRAGHPVRSIQTHPRSLLTWGLYDAPCLGTV